MRIQSIQSYNSKTQKQSNMKNPISSTDTYQNTEVQGDSFSPEISFKG